MNERELRQRLKQLLEEIRGGIRQDPGRPWGPAERRFQRETFHEIYTIVSQLFSNGHSTAFDGTLKSLVISSSDGSCRFDSIWHRHARRSCRLNFKGTDSSCPDEGTTAAQPTSSTAFAVGSVIINSARKTSTTSASQISRYISGCAVNTPGPHHLRSTKDLAWLRTHRVDPCTNTLSSTSKIYRRVPNNGMPSGRWWTWSFCPLATLKAKTTSALGKSFGSSFSTAGNSSRDGANAKKRFKRKQFLKN